MQALRFLAIALLLAPGLAHPDWIAGWYHVTIYIDVEASLYSALASTLMSPLYERAYLVEITTTEEVVGSVYPLVDECCKLYWRQDLWIYQQANHIILGSTRARLDCSKCANTFDPSIVNCAAIKPSPTIEWQKYL
ncbi:uncharacterized protein L969DRAFT_48662 [Mixia osmundae IAM 14324]|uniref:Uncharacterized protein n=1 Tax=Mixia osmundae (strain CBS 9802 / IAM 14324 / JCM 22182 / KY 12970) TaxID=764103 RepID=G7E492_MIXOS|nr:uncharacterized protein L969DRAFT_48662 [Mixia osmundae IAM 14324]KEI39748.1 hypothetical protein L969DRAFT_48662 [Mixia osmundae IAM 14324]GAA97652.1 hypothetical protein E5Q_04330 [Mixia osmundae IAM 14324]